MTPCYMTRYMKEIVVKIEAKYAQVHISSIYIKCVWSITFVLEPVFANNILSNAHCTWDKTMFQFY